MPRSSKHLRFELTDLPVTCATGFFKLPPELRSQIYKLVLPYQQTLWIWEKTSDAPLHSPRYLRNPHMALLRVNKLISAETRYLFYHNNTFECDGFRVWASFRDFLEVIGPSNCAMLRRAVLKITEESLGPVQELTGDESHYRFFRTIEDERYQRRDELGFSLVPAKLRPQLTTFNRRYNHLTGRMDAILHRRGNRERLYAEFVDADIFPCLALLKHNQAVQLIVVALEWDLPLSKTQAQDFIYRTEADELDPWNRKRYIVSTTIPDLLASICSQRSSLLSEEEWMKIHWTFQMPPHWLRDNSTAVEAAGWVILDVKEIRPLQDDNYYSEGHGGWSLITASKIIKEDEQESEETEESQELTD